MHGAQRRPVGALMDAWLPHRVRRGSPVRVATQPVHLRFASWAYRNNPVVFMRETSLCMPSACKLHNTPVLLLFATDVVNQKLGCTYFNINLMACTVARIAAILRSRDLFVGNGESELVSFPGLVLPMLIMHEHADLRHRRLDCGGS